MSQPSYRRHDISDHIWNRIEAYLPGSKNYVGRSGKDNRSFINGVLWLLRTGAPWRDLPPCYGNWSSIHKRFTRWRDSGAWERFLNIVMDDPDFEWLMIDSTFCKVHPHAAGARGGNQEMNRSKGGSTRKFMLPWMRMV